LPQAKNGLKNFSFGGLYVTEKKFASLGDWLGSDGPVAQRSHAGSGGGQRAAPALEFSLAVSATAYATIPEYLIYHEYPIGFAAIH